MPSPERVTTSGCNTPCSRIDAAAPRLLGLDGLARLAQVGPDAVHRHFEHARRLDRHGRLARDRGQRDLERRRRCARILRLDRTRRMRRAEAAAQPAPFSSLRYLPGRGSGHLRHTHARPRHKLARQARIGQRATRCGSYSRMVRP